jgi:hypothetical protein
MKLSPFITEVIKEVRDGCATAGARPLRFVEMEIGLRHDGALAESNNENVCRTSVSISLGSSLTPSATSLSSVVEDHHHLDR